MEQLTSCLPQLNYCYYINRFTYDLLGAKNWAIIAQHNAEDGLYPDKDEIAEALGVPERSYRSKNLSELEDVVLFDLIKRFLKVRYGKKVQKRTIEKWMTVNPKLIEERIQAYVSA